MLRGVIGKIKRAALQNNIVSCAWLPRDLYRICLKTKLAQSGESKHTKIREYMGGLIFKNDYAGEDQQQFNRPTDAITNIGCLYDLVKVLWNVNKWRGRMQTVRDDTQCQMYAQAKA
jgi:hypothetical protein